MRPFKSRLWIMGLLIFIGFSLINFAALALAPASVLTPLESVQFVSNIAWNRLVNKKAVSARMLFGVLLAVVGTALSVVFGPPGGGCTSVAQLRSNWSRWAYWVYFISSITLAVGAFTLYTVWTRRKRRGEALPPIARILLPISYTVSAALAGGAQMIVHSKVLSMLLALLFGEGTCISPHLPKYPQISPEPPRAFSHLACALLLGEGDTSLFNSWLLYVELALVTACGSLWGIKLTECLGLFDPLLILPLMIGTYILFGGLGAGTLRQPSSNRCGAHRSLPLPGTCEPVTLTDTCMCTPRCSP